MAAALLVAAVAGGVVAVAVASLVGVGEHTTTVREVGGFRAAHRSGSGAERPRR